MQTHTHKQMEKCTSIYRTRTQPVRAPPMDPARVRSRATLGFEGDNQDALIPLLSSHVRVRLLLGAPWLPAGNLSPPTGV